MYNRPMTKTESIRMWLSFLPAILTRIFFAITNVISPIMGDDLILLFAAREISSDT